VLSGGGQEVPRWHRTIGSPFFFERNRKSYLPGLDSSQAVAGWVLISKKKKMCPFVSEPLVNSIAPGCVLEEHLRETTHFVSR
jgi:hypothetical protein